MSNQKKNLPAKAEPSEDKHCAFIFEDGPKEGERCGAYRTSNSHLCSLHGDEATKVHQARTRNAKRRAQLQEQLEYEYHELQSIEGIAGFMEKLVNGIMTGFVKREKAGCVAMFLPTMYKIARDRNGGNRQQGPTTGIQINIGGVDTGKLGMSQEQLDQFVMGNEQVSIQVIEDLQKSGKIKIEKRKDKPDVVDIEAVEPIDPATIKIEKKELAALTKDTDIPLTTGQVENLFGSCLGDTEEIKPMAQDPAGFGHLFEPDGLPVESYPKRHDWKKWVKETKPGYGEMRYTCKNCGLETHNYKLERDCKKGNYDDDYRDKTILRSKEEVGIDERQQAGIRTPDDEAAVDLFGSSDGSGSE